MGENNLMGTAVEQAPTEQAQLGKMADVEQNVEQVSALDKEELQNAAEEEFAQEDFDAAGEKFWELAQIANEEGDRSMEMTCYKNIGTCLIYLEEPQEALHHWHKALTIADEIADVPNQIDIINKLGALFEQHGEPHRAIGCLNQLLHIHAEQGDSEAELAVLGSLASISYETEDYEMAVRHYEDILKRAEKLNDRELTGKVFSNLGTAHQELENIEQAQEYYQKSLDIAVEVKDKVMESRAYTNLADLCSMDSRFEDGASYYTKAIALCKELGDSFEAAKADVADLSEEEAAAHVEDCHTKVLMCKETEGKAYADLAAVHHELEQTATAKEDMERAIVLAEETGDKQAEGERLTQLATLKMFGNGEFDNAECEGHLQKSVDVWRQYAVALREQLVRDLDNEDIENPDLCNTRAASFFEAHAGTYSHLQKVMIAQDKKEDALLVAEEGRTQALYDLLQLTEDAELVDPTKRPVEFDQIAAMATARDSSIVMYSMVDPDRTLYVWTITPAGELIFNEINIEEILNKFDTSLSQSVRKLYESMASAAKGKLCRGPRDNRDAEDEEEQGQEEDIAELKHLYAALVEPIKQNLAADKDVIIVPHGVLSLVPYAALQDEAGVPMVKNFAIATAPSTRVLKCMLDRGEGLQMDGSLVVGNPDTLPQYELQDIPGAATEAEEVAAVCGGECQLLKGDAARMSKAAGMMQNVSTLHLACHSQPGILVLAPTLPSSEPLEEEYDDDRDEDYDDGLLHKDHIHCLRLMGKPTVVLSGSYTAAGNITEDGIVGLPRAFIAAGAKSVFATMWATQDESSPTLMKALHTQLKTPGGTHAQALRAAMLHMQEADGGKFAHPVHWAGFTLLGNPSK